MNNAIKSPLRYYKTRHSLPHKPPKPPKQPPCLSQSTLIEQLSHQVSQLQQCTLTFNNSCSCKVCANIHPLPIIKQDHYETNVEAYSCLFRLLQHLTMVEADEAPGILGELVVPMLFFKRQYQAKRKDSQQQRARKQQGQPSFIVFKSGIKNGHLEYPMLVKSLEKVQKVMRTHEQAVRKAQSDDKGLRIVNVHEVQDQDSEPEEQGLNNMVHKKFFNKQIPSYLLTSSKMRVQKSQVKKFIIHEQDRYIGPRQQSHKVKQSQPFCIFRYTSTDSGIQSNKYEIFTLETYKLHERNKFMVNTLARKGQERLQLMYIESYTRVKVQESAGRKKDKQKKEQQPVSVTYFTQYHDQDEECELLGLARLEVKLKSGKISHIDPIYMDKFTLEDRIEATLGLSTPITSQKISKVAYYKTYKIVSVLSVICRIHPKSLQLKWILNDHNKLVLFQCLEYQIDRGRSLNPKKNKDAHVEHILDNGMEFLSEGLVLEDKEVLFRSHDNVEEIVASKIEEKRGKCKTEGMAAEGMTIQDMDNKNRIKNISKSMNLQGVARKKPILEPLSNKYSTYAVRKSVPSTLMSYTHGINPMLMLASKHNMNVGNKSKKYGSPIKKSYKLRPLKTEATTTITHD